MPITRLHLETTELTWLFQDISSDTDTPRSLYESTLSNFKPLMVYWKLMILLDRDIVKTLHFVTLKFMSHFLLHKIRFSRSCCSFIQSSRELIRAYSLASSANSAIEAKDTTEGISLINSRNKRGPSMDP